jgi:hypothetical protein
VIQFVEQFPRLPLGQGGELAEYFASEEIETLRNDPKWLAKAAGALRTSGDSRAKPQRDGVVMFSRPPDMAGRIRVARPLCVQVEHNDKSATIFQRQFRRATWKRAERGPSAMHPKDILNLGLVKQLDGVTLELNSTRFPRWPSHASFLVRLDFKLTYTQSPRIAERENEHRLAEHKSPRIHRG